MPMILPAIAAIVGSVAAGVAAAGAAIGVAAGALVAGNLALAGTALLAVGDASLIGSFTVGTVLELGAMAGVSALLAPHPNVNTAGSPQLFKSDPNAPIPIIMGRYGVGGYKVYETTSGGSNGTAEGAKGNEYLTQFTILSGNGPIELIETLRFNDTILTFDPNGQACNGGYIPYDEVQAWNPGYTHQNTDGSYINNNFQDHAWQNTQLGAMVAPYFSPPSKLASDKASLPEWTAAHGFSSFAASSLTLVYDQRYYAGGVPQYQWVLQGHKLYDPRKDSTYPGGNGSHRWAGKGATKAQILAARATWEFSQNPHIHALNFALGYYYPDAETGLSRLYAGIGAGPTGVVMDAFVRAANVADANGWVICGQWTTGDGKWSVLTAMLGAGAGSPVFDRGLISCIVSTPLTSLGTVTADDLSGAPITLDTGASMTARINTVFPRFTSEAHRWALVQADTPVKAQTYVTEDGGIRSRTIDWQYVPAVNQACQLAAYTITDGRELTGIVLPGKPKLRNYAVGDCFTVDIPEAGLATTKVMVTKRSTNPATGGVTLTVRTETDAKHAYSLGLTGVAPATPGISGYDPTIVAAPLPDNWATGVLEISDPITGEATSVLSVVGDASDDVYAQTVILRWRPVTVAGNVVTPTGTGAWTYRSFAASTGSYQLDLNAGTYDVQIGYVSVNGAYPDPANDADWTDLGVEAVGGSTSAATASVPGTAKVGDGDTTMSDALAGLATAQGDISTLESDVTAAQGEIADLQSDQNADVLAAQQAEAAAQAAEQGALNAQGLANQYMGEAEGYANTAETQAGLATTAADGSAASQAASQTAAGSAADSATAANSSQVAAQVAAASTLPSRFGQAGLFFTAQTGVATSPASLPSADFGVDAGDGSTVFISTSYAPIASVGMMALTPAHAYEVKARGALPNGGASYSVVGLVIFDATKAALGLYELAIAEFGNGSYTTLGGDVTTEQIKSGGFPTAASVRPVALLNWGTDATGQTQAAVKTFLSDLSLVDVTQSVAAAGSASAASASESGAQAAESAAGVFTSEAQTAETNSAASSDQAGDSATASEGYAGQANTSAGDASAAATTAESWAGQSEYQAGLAEGAQAAATTQAGFAQTYAEAADASSASAQSSADLVANYSPGTNLIEDPNFVIGNPNWTFGSGAEVANSADRGSYLIVGVASGDVGTSYIQLAVSKAYEAPASSVLSLQAEMYSGAIGATTTFARVGIQFLTSGGQQCASGGYVLAQTNQRATWTRYTAAGFTVPSDAATYRIIIDLASSSGDLIGTGDNVAFQKLKLENGSVCTPFTDDQLSAAIVQQALVAANATEAVAQELNSLSVTVGGNSSDVTELQGAVATLDGKNLAWLQEAATASGSAPAKFQLVSGDGTSLAGLLAQVISLSNVLGNGSTVDVLTLVNGLAFFANKVFIGSTIYLDPSLPGLIVNTGSAALVIGSNFGTTGDLIFWFGPALAPASMSKSNGKIWFDAAGDAYFGGSLSAGTLTTKVATSDTSTSAVAETAAFGSNGGTITVTLSYSYAAQAGNATGGAAKNTSAPDPGPTYVDLYRSINGSAYALVATLSTTGTFTNVQDSDSDLQSDTIAGSLTYTDPQTVAQNRQYKGVLRSRSTTLNTNIAQNLSVICVEQ